MWLFSEDGYISAVEWAPRPQKNGRVKLTAPYRVLLDLPSGEFFLPTKDTLGSHLLVRARVKADLDKLAGYDPYSVFTEDKTADYRYRLVIRRTAVRDYVANLVMKLDYDSHVKEVITARAPQTEAGKRYTGMMSVWSATANWQATRPYSGLPNTGTGVSAVKAYSTSPKVTANNSMFGAPDISSALTDIDDTIYSELGTDPETGTVCSRRTMKDQLRQWVDFSPYADNIYEVSLDALAEIVMNTYGLCDIDRLSDDDIDRLVVDNLHELMYVGS